VLTAQGLMKQEGLDAFENRNEKNTAKASYEQPIQTLSAAYLTELKKHEIAFSFFNNQPSYYRKACIHWIMSAKKEETREKRLGVLISSGIRQQRIPQFSGPDKGPPHTK
jgi:uncharacterized protein YdeI (YjbR/CyaY-like superfamily)